MKQCEVWAPEIEEHFKQLRERMEKTSFGDVGLVFTMNNGKVTLIKPINLPVIKPGENDGKC